MDLYGQVSPPWDPIPINVKPFPIEDDVPDDMEICGVVRIMRNSRAARALGIQIEHIELWLNGSIQEE